MGLVDSDSNKRACISYFRFLKTYSKLFTKKEFDYLSKFEIRDSYFYGLPKIHKSTEIMSKCKENRGPYLKIVIENDLKLRPIIGGPSCLTHRLSNVIHI